ncbi:putative leucine-rich repeat domain, L domain-containing protein [Medicago truncatula]|nr:putative leucine-rich repeat domain, L domain-containing protein [Medicago truncatula]
MSDGEHFTCDDKAFIIAKKMHGLLHLVLHGDPLSDVGLLAILDGCPRLESLDIFGCYNLDFEGSLWKRLHTQIKDLY